MRTRAQDPIQSDAEKALQAALAVTPSPEFAARVRERVRHEPWGAPRAWWPTLAVAGGAALAAIIVATLWTSRAGPERAPVARSITNESAAKPPRPSTGPVIASAASQPPVVAPVPSTLRRPAVAPPVARPAAAREPPREVEVLVPADERRALDRLLAAMREGRAAVPAPRRVLVDEHGLLLEPRPIEIPLMTPIEPLPGMAVERSGSKER